MQLPAKTTNSFVCVAFDEKSRSLIAGGGGELFPPTNSDHERHREFAAWSLPDCKLLWSTCEPAADFVCSLILRPGGDEIATQVMSDLLIFSAKGKYLRKYKTDFLSGNLVYSMDGELFVSPKGQSLKLCSSDTGEVVHTIELSKNIYTSAQVAAFTPDGKHVVVALSVINSKGQKSGQLQLVDLAKKEVVKSANIEKPPSSLNIEPQGKWACVSSEMKDRSSLLFWDLPKWELVAEQKVPVRVTGLAISPTGTQLAYISTDKVICILDYVTRKTIQKIEHAAENLSNGSVAWSADGKYLAYSAGGEPPSGGLFLYRQINGQWELLASEKEKAAGAKSAVQLAATPRLPIRVYASKSQLDVIEYGQLMANQFPLKCEHCSFPDLDAVPQPYVLMRGHAATGDFSGAAYGNMLVSARTRRVFEVATPGAVKFYPTVDAKTSQPTNWFLAVPQTVVSAYSVKSKAPRCPQCGELKEVEKLTPLAEIDTTADVFKAKEWDCNHLIESGDRLAKKYYKAQKGQIPAHQWIRLFLGRNVLFSPRLLFLLRELKLTGITYEIFLENKKPTPAEAAWVEEKLQLLRAAPAADTPVKKPEDATKWFRNFLKDKKSDKPLAQAATIAAWEKKNKIKLPKSYADFVTTVGRLSFGDVLGREGYSVRVVGPKSLDAREYRRDLPEDGGEAEPDGLLFAVAINGDAFCFDLRGAKQDYPVFHFDHEMERFEPFADNFAAAIKRMSEQE